MPRVMHCIIGIANAGKTTLINRLKAEGERVVQVGQEMRKRYPPEYFQGKGSMLSTEPEVVEILLRGIDNAFLTSDRVYIDGNPRSVGQAAYMIGIAKYFCMEMRVTLLTAAHDELIKRAEKRSSDPEVVALALSRVKNDTQEIQEVARALIDFGISLNHIDTTFEQPSIGVLNG